MAHIIVDRRQNPKGKSTVNRQRFVDRVKDRVRKSVQDAVRDGKIADIASDKKEKVTVPAKDIKEPTFTHGRGGNTERVYPGNKDFIPGDRVPRPDGGGGQGKGKNASKGGEGEDDFQFTLTREEFMEIFFEDLQLPNMEEKDVATVEEYTTRRAGFVTDGDPANLDLLRSMKGATARRIALRNPKKKKIRELEEERDQILREMKGKAPDEITLEKEHVRKLEEEIATLKRKLKAVPFIDEIDLKFHNRVKDPKPVTQAVMFCIMDVSGSMGEWEKEMAKRFFMLLYLFLTRSYEKIDLIFIRHHTTAKEVDEEEFFYSKETGGTMVSPALQMMDDIIKERYPLNQWNVYGCQASDGDNWRDDNDQCLRIMNTSLLKKVRYYAYIEINERNEGDLWQPYKTLKASHKNFDQAKITDAADIFPVFRGLFSTTKA